MAEREIFGLAFAISLGERLWGVKLRILYGSHLVVSVTRMTRTLTINP